MGVKKNFSGYKAYQYLDPEVDYKEFKFREAIRKDWAYTVPLSKSEEERFEEIIEKNIIIDLHEHPCLCPEDASESMELENMGRAFIAYDALSVSGIDCVFDNMMDGSTYITSYSGWKWTDVIHDIGIRLSDIYHQEMIIPCFSVKDIKYAYENGKIAFVLVLEAASPIENEIDRIDVLYGLGIRSMGICYSESNMLGGGMHEMDLTTSLTDFGYDAVKRMNKLGMLIDIGHTNDKTAIDTIEASEKPIYNSHSGPSSIAKGHTTSDEVLQALAEKEGMIGVGGAGRGLSTKKNPVGNIESYMECVEYCIDLMGIDYVGAGPDTMYGDHQGLYKYWYLRRYRAHYERPSKLPRVRRFDFDPAKDPGYVKGLENPNEFVNIARWMIKHGYSDVEVSKIVGLNALSMLEKVW